MHPSTRRLLIALILPSLIACQTVTDPLQRAKEDALERREQDANGIAVGSPKVYDDSLLQQMLLAAQTRLATLQLIDQTSIGARVGSITGASQQISSFALSALGNPTPGVTTTANGPTKQVVDTANTTAPQTVTTTTAPVQNTVTTAPQITASIPTTPAPSTTLPTALSGSASDILNEELQLTYEIANLRLLLEGALSDRIFTTKDQHRFVKPRVTVGFPIAITPRKQYHDAIAVVEAEVWAGDEDLSKGTEAPAITALLPREKTYNVASITDRSTSIGAGIVTQIAAISGSFLSARKTYYIVKDQDTIAATFRPSPVPQAPPRTGFAWQFRPVLGQTIVQAGLKQTFVQLTFPTTETTPVYGHVHVRTYWRKYDAGSGALKGIVPGSLRDDDLDVPILRFDMEQNLDTFTVDDNTEDLGNGQMLIRLEGRFLGGTAVRIGGTVLQPGSPGFEADDKAIRFIAPIADLATKKTVVVTRDGTETPLVEQFDCIDDQTPVVTDASVEAVDEANSRLTITTAPPRIDNLPPLVLIIGGKVFGYADAPVTRDGNELSVVLPTAFLSANHSVTIKPLLVDKDYAAQVDVLAPGAQAERLVLVKQTGKTLRYLLYGRDLGNVDMIVPDVPLKPVGDGAEQDNVRFVEITPPVAKTLKAVVLQRRGERPFAIPLPPLVEPAKAEPVKPKFSESVTVGADDATIVGDGLKDVVKIVALKQDLTNLELSNDGKALKVKGLAAAGITAAAKTVDCDLVTKAGKTTIQLKVVSSKVEVQK